MLLYKYYREILWFGFTNYKGLNMSTKEILSTVVDSFNEIKEKILK